MEFFKWKVGDIIKLFYWLGNLIGSFIKSKNIYSIKVKYLSNNVVWGNSRFFISGVEKLYETYIRHLIYSVKKNVIFISPKLAANIDSPDFTEFLIKNPNSIFVIEDAENLIVSRDSENNSAISMILNLTDGLLGEGLVIQFICTFNTHLSRIDKALLRKGRLKALYEFGALSVDKSNYLLESLNLNYETNKPMTLAEIYNLKEERFDFDGEKKVIGFAA